MTIGVFWEFYEYFGDALLGMDMQKDSYINAINTVLLDQTGTNTVEELKDITEVVIKYGDGRELILDSYIDVGLRDTIGDLLVNFIGAFVFTIIGFWYLLKRGNGKIAKQFIPTLMEDASKDEEIHE
jgi:hypothetical protein